MLRALAELRSCIVDMYALAARLVVLTHILRSRAEAHRRISRAWW